MLDAPYRELILVFGAAGVGRVAFAVFDGQRVFNQLLLWPVKADAEDARIYDLVYALVKLEQDRIQVKRRSDLLANFAQQFDRVFLRGNLRCLCTDLVRALIDSRFKSSGLRFESIRLAACLLPLVAADNLPRSQGQQQ